MASNKLVLTLALMLLIATTIVPLDTHALACNQVTSSLAPCLNYLEQGGSPTSGCCNGVANLWKAANTTPALQQACNCLKSLYKSVKGIQLSFASALPGKCNVKIPYNISPSINCNTLK